MPILGVQTTPSLHPGDFVIFLLLPLLLAGLRAAGFFRSDTIVGPPRLHPAESLLTLLLILFGGALVGLVLTICSGVFLKLPEQQTFVIGNTLFAVFVFIAMLSLSASFRPNAFELLGLTSQKLARAIVPSAITIALVVPLVAITSSVVGILL